MRALWVAVGVLAVALGLLGAVLPLLPTTPFLLVAAWAFGRSSPRWHAWLLQHPTLGPGLRRWQERGAISRRAKVAALVAIAITLAIGVLMGVSGPIFWIQVTVLAAVSTFIVSRPES